MMMRIHRGWPIVFLMAVLLCGLTACLKWFDVECNRFDVANLTLQTLVNTYPDSEYASKAAVELEDPRIAKCGERWNSPPDCHESFVTTPPTETKN
jgi:hypothetical protein